VRSAPYLAATTCYVSGGKNNGRACEKKDNNENDFSIFIMTFLVILKGSFYPLSLWGLIKYTFTHYEVKTRDQNKSDLATHSLWSRGWGALVMLHSRGEGGPVLYHPFPF